MECWLAHWQHQTACDPCHELIPELSPLEPQRAGNLLIPWHRTQPAAPWHLLQGISGTPAAAAAASQKAQTTLGCWPCSEHTLAPAQPCASRALEKMVRVPITAWAAYRVLYTPEKSRSKARPQPAKKSPIWGTRHRQPITAACSGAEQGLEDLLACAKGPGADLGMEVTERHTWQHNIPMAGCDFGSTQDSTALSLHLHAAHKTHSPRPTSSFRNPSADSHSCYFKIKEK